MVGGDGKTLGNVFVYVKDGLGNYVFDTPTETGEDRPEGMPLPSARVRHARRPAARDRQQRSDAAQHPRDAEGQLGVQQRPADPGHEDDATPSTAKEVMVPFKCDVHGWMNAYVGVLDHPYFAVTDKDGKFELKSLPPGHLHDRSVAREARHADRERDARREGIEGRHLHVQGRGARPRRTSAATGGWHEG